MIQDLVDKVSTINHLHSVQETLTNVPPLIMIFRQLKNKPPLAEFRV